MAIVALDVTQRTITQIKNALQTRGLIGTIHVDTDLNMIFTMPNYSDKAIRIYHATSTAPAQRCVFVEVGDFVSGTTLTNPVSINNTNTSNITIGNIFITADYVGWLCATAASTYFITMFFKSPSGDFIAGGWTSDATLNTNTQFCNTTKGVTGVTIGMPIAMRDFATNQHMTSKFAFVDTAGLYRGYDTGDKVMGIYKTGPAAAPLYEAFGNDIVIPGGKQHANANAILQSVLLKGAGVAFP